MNYQSSSFGGEERCNENLWKSKELNISKNTLMIFLSFVDLCVVQKFKQAKLFINSVVIVTYKNVLYMHFSKLLQESRWAINLCSVSIELTLLLFLLILNFLGCSYILTRLKKYKIVAERLDVQTQQKTILI